ncbi:hypothetical protein CBL_05148 [Carabus blaptoides fortunei]
MEDTVGKDNSPEMLRQLIEIQHEEILLLSNRLEQAISAIEALSNAVLKSANTVPTQPSPALQQTTPSQAGTVQQSQDPSKYVSQMETDTDKVSKDIQGQKRKRTKKKSNTAPKKKELDAETLSSLVPTSSDSSSDTESESKLDQELTTPQPSKSGGEKVSPIIMRKKANSMNVIHDLANQGIKVKEAINRADCIRLHVETAKDFRAVTSQFVNKEIPFHTYQLNEDKLLKAVIRGIPEDINTDEIKLALEVLKYPVISVTRMKSGPTRKPLPMVLVQLKKPEGKEIFQLTNILYLRTTPPKLDKGTFAEVSKNKKANATPSTSADKQNENPTTTVKFGNTADTLIDLLNIINELNSAKSSAEQIPILLKAITKLQQ